MKKRLITILICVLLAVTLGLAITFIAIRTYAPTDASLCRHVDEDDNGLCDRCRNSVLVVIDFVAINDLHGRFADTDSQPGVDELTTYLKYLNADKESTVLLSSGDMWQGSSESNMTKGQIIVEWMNELGFVSMTLGNHEFDWGEDTIIANEALADFPFLAINIYDSETNERVPYCQASVVIERCGVKIGIIGAIGDCYSSISSDKTEGLYFVNGFSLTLLVEKEAKRLREEESVDCIIYSIHDGYENSIYGESFLGDSNLSGYYDASLSRYVDLVFEGHTHKSYVATDGHGVYHLQDGGENEGVSHVTVGINVANSKNKVKKAEIISASTYKRVESDSLRDELLDKYEAQIAPASAVLGNNAKERSGDELRQKVAELYYEKGIEIWGREYDIVLGGGFISVRKPYSLAAGDVLYSDLQSLFPFDNELVLCQIRGADLKTVFFESQNANYFWFCGEYGEEVKNNLDEKATYFVITDTYSSTYRNNHMTEIQRLGQDLYARDLLADYVKSGGFAR